MDMTFSPQLYDYLKLTNTLANSLAQRIQAQIDFARELADLHPDRKPHWSKLIDSAVETINKSLSGNDLQQAVKEAENILAPIAQVAKTYTISYIGHAHIDMNWMWSWPETVAVTNDTFITVLKLMDEFPDFRFSQSQASVYAIIQEYNPDLFEKIKERVRQGRWEVTASQWVEGDKNLASGESLARHLMYTRQFFKDYFDLTPNDIQIGWEPDTFGHAATIPSILSAGGVKYYYMCRGGEFEKPPIFYWHGPDGAKILVNLEQSWYLNQIGPHNLQPMLQFCRKTGLQHWMCVYGVGDHGGGPTRRDLRKMREMQTWPIFPNLKFSVARDYYKFLETEYKNIPVLTGELNFEFTGCYSSQSSVKKMNRRGENELQRAETTALLASRTVSRSYPASPLKGAWLNILFGQFHDILPGSCVKVSREYQSGLFQQTLATANTTQTNSLRQFANDIDTSFAQSTALPVVGSLRSFGAGTGRGVYSGDLTQSSCAQEGRHVFVVFNPTAWQRKEMIKLTLWDVLDESDLRKITDLSFTVRHPDGTVIPAQQIGNGDYWGHSYVDIAFPATIPSLGYSTFSVEYADKRTANTDLKLHSHNCIYRARELGTLAISNNFLELHFNSQTGTVEKFIDNKTGLDLVKPGQPFAALEYVIERPGPMSAWTIHPPKTRTTDLEVLSAKPVHRGPNVASILVNLKYNDSTFAVEYIIKADQPWMEINVSANWLERGSPDIGTPKLCLKFPLGLDDISVTSEIPFGSITRKLNPDQEIPSQKWLTVSGSHNAAKQPASLALLNDATYSYSLADSDLRATLIRSFYEPDPLPEMGEHEMRFAVMPSGVTMTDSALLQAGIAFNQPLQVIGTDVHKGRLSPNSEAAVISDPNNVCIVALKKAEDADAIIIRLLETSGAATNATVSINSEIFGKMSHAQIVDLIEQPFPQPALAVDDNRILVQLAASSILTLKVFR